MKVIKSSIIATILLAGTLNAGDVLATVNGVAINKSEIDNTLKSRGITFDKMPKSQQKQILDRLIERELLVNIAKKDGVENDAEYKKSLESLKKDLLIKTWMDKVYKKTLISDSEANKYYQDHKEQFKEQAKVHARHILVKSEDEAKKIIEELKPLKEEALKKKFIELAKSKSTGPSGKNGGDLGFFGKGQMVKPFEEAAFSMKKGEVSTKPVKTQFGYHIIYLEDTKSASYKPFDKVKKQIIAKLRQDQFRNAIKTTIDKVKKESKIDIKADIKDSNSSK
jgi:EpsD family peptidyl-prolyl cis-trans isomerase